MTAPAARPDRRGLYWPWGVGVALAAAYAGYWLWAARAIPDALAQAAAARAAHGETASFGAVAVSGFPLRLTVEATGVRWARPAAGWRVEADRLVFTAAPYALDHWVVEEVGLLRVAGPGGASWTLAGAEPQGSVRWRAGALQRASMTAAGATLTGPRGVTQIGPLQLHAVADPARPRDLALMAEARDIALPGAAQGAVALLGRQIAQARLAGLAVGLAPALGDPVGWARAGGVLDVRDGRLAWGGLRLADLTGRLSGAPTGWSGRLDGEGGLAPPGADAPLAAPVFVAVQDNRLRAAGLDLFAARPSPAPQAPAPAPPP